MTLDDRIQRVRFKRMADESIRGIGSGTAQTIVREQSKTERDVTWHKRGHFLYFCVHDKSKFTPCVSCKRTQHDAELNYEAFAELLK
jgi:hypothetical protein